jgi:FkbM family methyltransferase
MGFTTTSLRHGVGHLGVAVLRLLPGPLRGRAARGIVRLIPQRLRASAAGRLVPLLPPAEHLPIATGYLAGWNWVADSSLESCLLGTYELENQHALLGLLEPKAVVFDVGANVGFFTLLAARAVGSAGTVVAFEPAPNALALLRRHLALNPRPNIQLVAAAVGATSGTAAFHTSSASSIGRLDAAGETMVQVVALDDEIDNGRLPIPDVIKIDVEGFEAAVLDGARRLLATRGPALIVSTHGSEAHGEVIRLLSELGYDVEALSGRDGDETFDVLGEVVARPAARGGAGSSPPVEGDRAAPSAGSSG